MKIETVTGYKCGDGTILGSMDEAESHQIHIGLTKMVRSFGTSLPKEFDRIILTKWLSSNRGALLKALNGDYSMRDADRCLSQQSSATDAERFCDSHCSWRDHHPDCPSHESEQGGTG